MENESKNNNIQIQQIENDETQKNYFLYMWKSKIRRFAYIKVLNGNNIGLVFVPHKADIMNRRDAINLRNQLNKKREDKLYIWLIGTKETIPNMVKTEKKLNDERNN